MPKVFHLTDDMFTADSGDPSVEPVDALSVRKAAFTLRDALASFLKANHWWSQQPRDKYGRWTKGLVQGAYSPLTRPGQGDVAPIVSHEPGSPFAVGGAFHGNAPGWQRNEKVKGARGAIGQPAGSSLAGDPILPGKAPIALGPGKPDKQLVKPQLPAKGGTGKDKPAATGATVSIGTAGGVATGASGKRYGVTTRTGSEATGRGGFHVLDGEHGGKQLGYVNKNEGGYFAQVATERDKAGFPSKYKTLSGGHATAEDAIAALVNAHEGVTPKAPDAKGGETSDSVGRYSWGGKKFKTAEERDHYKYTGKVLPPKLPTKPKVDPAIDAQALADAGDVYNAAVHDNKPDEAAEILDKNPLAVKHVQNYIDDKDTPPEDAAKLKAFLDEYTDARKPIDPTSVDPNDPTRDKYAGDLSTTTQDGRDAQIASTHWRHDLGRRWDDPLHASTMNPDDDYKPYTDTSGWRGAHDATKSAYVVATKAIKRVERAMATMTPARAARLREQYAPLFYDHARMKRLMDAYDSGDDDDPRNPIVRAVDTHRQTYRMAQSLGYNRPKSFAEAVKKLDPDLLQGATQVEQFAKEYEMYSGKRPKLNLTPRLPTRAWVTGDTREAETAGKSWNGDGPVKPRSRYDIANTTPLKRWDHNLHNEADPRSVISYAGYKMRDNVNLLEAAMRDGSLDERAAMREKHAPLYYDLHRADRVDRAAPDEKEAAVAHLIRTRKLAKVIATKNFPSLKEARIYCLKHLPKSDPMDVAREYILHKHSIDMLRQDHRTAGYERGGFKVGHVTMKPFSFHEPTMGEASAIDDAVGATFGAHARSPRVTTIAHAKADTKEWTPSHANHEAGYINMIEQRDRPWSNEDHRRTIAHEMAHSLSGSSLKPEMDKFNEFMRSRIPRSVYAHEKIGQGEPMAHESSVEGIRPHLRQFVTEHAANSGDHKRAGGAGDYQEDWAIGLTDGGLSDFGKLGHYNATSSSGYGKHGLPTREAMEHMMSLFGKAPVAGLENRRTMPTVDAEGFSRRWSPEEKAQNAETRARLEAKLELLREARRKAALDEYERTKEENAAKRARIEEERRAAGF